MITVALPVPPREELERRYDELRDSYDRLLFELQRRIRTALTEKELNATIKYRVKSFKSYHQKLLRIARENPEAVSVVLTDLLALRVICPFLEEVAEAERILRTSFEIHETDRKGAKFSVREFGYESTHCLIRVPQDLCESFHLAGPLDCEVQLRTILQDAWAEVEHEIIYKGELTPLDESLQRKLAALNASLSLSDITFQEIRNHQRALTAELSERRRALHRSIGRSVTGYAHGNGSPAPADLDDRDAWSQGGASVDERPAPDSPTLGAQDSELLAALRAHNSGSYERAREIYSRLLDDEVNDRVKSVIYMHRGMAYFAQGSYLAAADDFSAAIEIDANAARAYFYRGTVYRMLGDQAAAEKEFDRCLDLDPYHVDCLYQRGALRLQNGDINGAQADCDSALRLEPDSAVFRSLASAIHERRTYGGAD